MRIRLRRSEWLLTVYFVYTAILAAAVLPVRAPVPAITAGLNAVVISGFLILAAAEPLRHSRFLSVLRDWYPLSLSLLAYREMGWFAPASHSFELERGWVQWDRLLLDQWGLKAAIELLGPVLPSMLEVSYTLVYAIPPFSLAALSIWGRRERADSLLTVIMIGTLGSFALFPLFPSEPPRAVFPGELFPSWNTPFRQFNWWFLGGQGIHTSVFPSAHVSASFSAAFGLMRLLPERRWVGRFVLLLAASIATATVYGRYHYAVDAAAGLGIAVLAHFAGKGWDGVVVKRKLCEEQTALR